MIGSLDCRASTSSASPIAMPVSIMIASWLMNHITLRRLALRRLVEAASRARSCGSIGPAMPSFTTKWFDALSLAPASSMSAAVMMPPTSWPSSVRASYANCGMVVKPSLLRGLFLGALLFRRAARADDLVQRLGRHCTGADLLHAVVEHRAHPALLGDSADVAQRQVAAGLLEHLLVGQQHLVDPGPPAVARVLAAVTALALEAARERRLTAAHLGEHLEQRRWDRDFLLAVLAHPADEPLGEHAFDGGGDEVRLDAHVDDSRDRAGRVVRVQRAEHEVARQRRFGRELGRLGVANFAD